MKEYHKIQTVYYRSPESNFKDLIEGKWACDEFEVLQDISWEWTEKIDGTNIRVMWDPNLGKLRFGGKTEDAQIPTVLLDALQDMFPPEKMAEVFNNPDAEVCLYGEGYGRKIQKGGNYLKDKTSFILFDIRIGNWWLKREDVEELGKKLGIEVVPIVGVGTLKQAVALVKKGFVSTIAENKEYIAEGLIMKPVVELMGRNGKRIVAKIKYKDFKHES